MSIKNGSNKQAVQAHVSTTCVHGAESQLTHNMLVYNVVEVMIANVACVSLLW